MIQPRPDVVFGTYRHYKGGDYEVYDLTCDEATGEWRISYRPLYEIEAGMPDRWSRPIHVFFEEINLDGLTRKRFEKLDD